MTMNFKCIVPEGEKDGWRINTVTVTQKRAEVDNLQMLMNGHGYAMVKPGKYKRLIDPKNQIVMSEAPMERRTCQWIINNAEGYVLINGLGLGIVLAEVLAKPEVREVWTVEREQAVIDLVWPTFTANPKAKLIHADAMTWRPPKGMRFDVVWHDIWTTMSQDNLDDMKVLHRGYGRIAGKQASWGHDILKAERRRDQRRGW